MLNRAMMLGVLAAMLVGCETENYRQVRLGEVDYSEAYAAGLDVFADYYTVASADAATGLITAQPTRADAPPDMLLTNVPTREVAEMRIREDNRVVWADIRIAVERLDTESHRNIQALDQHRDIPNQTPAELDAGLTPQQQQTWTRRGYNYEKERVILRDVYSRMHPGESQ